MAGWGGVKVWRKASGTASLKPRRACLAMQVVDHSKGAAADGTAAADGAAAAADVEAQKDTSWVDAAGLSQPGVKDEIVLDD
jgi:hypothetical protein